MGSPATRTLQCKLKNPSTAVKPVATELQILFVALAKMDISQMTLGFSLNYFSLNSLNSVTKLCHYNKRTRTWLTQPPLVWETSMLPQHQLDTCEIQIFKLNPIHASVIYQFPWIHWIPVLFRENPTNIYFIHCWLTSEIYVEILWAHFCVFRHASFWISIKLSLNFRYTWTYRFCTPVHDRMKWIIVHINDNDPMSAAFFVASIV